MVPEAPVEKSPPRATMSNQINSSSLQTLNIKPIKVEAASESGDIEAILKDKIEKTNDKI